MNSAFGAACCKGLQQRDGPTAAGFPGWLPLGLLQRDLSPAPELQQRQEGNARLLRCLDADPEMERWKVRFTGDYYSVERNIAPRKEAA